MRGLLGLGLLNGLCLVALLACIRIIAGTGLAEAVGLGRAEIMSQRHIELAFLVTAAGVVLGYSGTTPVSMFDFLRRLVLRTPAKAAPQAACAARGVRTIVISGADDSGMGCHSILYPPARPGK